MVAGEDTPAYQHHALEQRTRLFAETALGVAAGDHGQPVGVHQGHALEGRCHGTARAAARRQHRLDAAAGKPIRRQDHRGKQPKPGDHASDAGRQQRSLRVSHAA